MSPSDREEPPEAIHVVAQGLVQHRCLKCGCIEMISYKIRYQQLDCKIPLSKENNASYGPLLNCLCQILTLPPTLPSICIFWLVVELLLPPYQVKTVFSFSSHLWHQHWIFTQRTAAHWRFSMFWTVLCKPQRLLCERIQIQQFFKYSEQHNNLERLRVT